MLKSQLIRQVALRTNYDLPIARNVVNTTFDIIKEQMLQGNNVQIHGFATFQVRHLKTRVGLTGANYQLRPKASIRWNTPFRLAVKNQSPVIPQGATPLRP